MFGRIDDDQPWRVGLYGIDQDGDQLVIDWRAPFAGGFYQARLDEPMGLDAAGHLRRLHHRPVHRGLHLRARSAAPLRCSASCRAAAAPRCAPPSPPSSPSRTRSSGSTPPPSSCCAAGPGTGKTVVGLHRAAWLVYNDRRLTAGRILVVGPSDRFLRFVVRRAPDAGRGPDRPDHLRPAARRVDRGRQRPAVARRARPVRGRPARRPARSRSASRASASTRSPSSWSASAPGPSRGGTGARRSSTGSPTPTGSRPATSSKAAAEVWPPMHHRPGACAGCGRRPCSRSWAWTPTSSTPGCATPRDGALLDEVRARFEGVPATYGHVIVDEAQDLSLLQLRAVQRRSAGLTLVGDDAQRSSAQRPRPPRRPPPSSSVHPAEMATAYRMSAEIADWLNDHAAAARHRRRRAARHPPDRRRRRRGGRRPVDRRGPARRPRRRSGRTWP